MVSLVCPMNSVHCQTLKDHAIPNPGSRSMLDLSDNRNLGKKNEQKNKTLC